MRRQGATVRSPRFQSPDVGRRDVCTAPDTPDSGKCALRNAHVASGGSVSLASQRVTTPSPLQPARAAQDRSATPELALILGAARSGTTLLRSLLDAHPEIGCPAEAGIPALLGHARATWGTVASSVPANTNRVAVMADTPVDPEVVPPLPVYAERELRRMTYALMRYYCRHDRKRIYCDKSLDSTLYLPAVYKTVPTTKCVIIIRHVMDTIVSGLEASPWGFSAFGYLPFVQASPENFVFALAQYWEAQVGRALTWLDRHPETCIQIRYEDLVARPEATLAVVFGFLGVASDMSVLTRAFRDFSSQGGPGDYKLDFTREITDDSVGRGKRVPIDLIPPPLLDRVNVLLERGGYPLLSATWNQEPAEGGRDRTVVAGALDRLVVAVAAGPLHSQVDALAIVADDDVESRWVVNIELGTAARGDGEVDIVVTGRSTDLLSLLGEAENLGVLIRTGRIRCVTGPGRPELRAAAPRILKEIVERGWPQSLTRVERADYSFVE